MADQQTIAVSMTKGAGAHYLGSVKVVRHLLAEMLARWVTALESGDKARIKQDGHALVKQYGDIFCGQNPDYQIIDGYHDFTLANKLRADLGAFFKDHQAEYDHNPVHALMGYLLVMYVNDRKRYNNDEALMHVHFGPKLNYATQVILGTEKRQQ
jgi:hypothetical protein